MNSTFPTAEYEAIKEIKTEMNTLFVFIAALFVFLMQAGFALLEAGTLRSKNVRNILTKNLLEPITGAICFWLVGYGVAYGGDNDNGFAGNAGGGGKFNFAFRVDDHGDDRLNNLAGAENGYAWVGFFFQYCFAAAATTIVSGAVAGRVSIYAYFVYSTVMITVIYPVVVHWVWDNEGWLCAWGSIAKWGGAIDFAGSGVVHMTGGFCAITAAIILGPRKNRFTEPDLFIAHSAPLQVLGTMLLWVGWYGFNCGSTLGIHGQATEVGRVAVTTTLSACGGAMVAVSLTKVISGKFDLGMLCNGTLGGLVGVTAGCSVVEPYAALVIGLISGCVVVGAHHLVLMAEIDDPIDAFAVHGCCGAWGVIAVGVFATDYYTYNANGHAGFFYGDNEGQLLGIQLLLVLCVMAWTVPLMAITVLPLKFAGLLRVPDNIQEQGIDIHVHESAAYTIVPVTSLGAVAEKCSSPKKCVTNPITPPTPQTA